MSGAVRLARDARRYALGPVVGRPFTLRVREPLVERERGGRCVVRLNRPDAAWRSFQVVPRAKVLTGGYYGYSTGKVYVDGKLPRRDQEGIAVHEATEFMLRRKGLPYDSTAHRRRAAHQEANRMEKLLEGARQFHRETLDAFRVIDYDRGRRASLGFLAQDPPPRRAGRGPKPKGPRGRADAP